MTKSTVEQIATEESARIGREDVTAVIDRVIGSLPAHTRMYPDLYAHYVTEALIEADLLKENPHDLHAG